MEFFVSTGHCHCQVGASECKDRGCFLHSNASENNWLVTAAATHIPVFHHALFDVIFYAL